MPYVLAHPLLRATVMLALFVGMCTLALWLYECGAKFFIKYHLRDDGVVVTWFGLPLTKIRYANITQARIASFWEILGDFRLTLRAGNRLSGPYVLIRTQRSFPFGDVVITPDDAQAFVASIERKRSELVRRAV